MYNDLLLFQAYPEHAGIHNHIANVLAAQGKLEKAVNHYTKALTIDPDLAIR
ncbi:MAG: tetratricopeptide repeat protein, partial [Proteobacteria bacterium]|nr:tetratricopeptide repeat protein [Pseudomonadota bacterium]